MAEHAKLSPSASERWLSCPASIRMETLVPAEVESAYAREGTCAHELGEMKAALALGHITHERFVQRRANWRKLWSEILDEDEVEVEMERHTDSYVELILERKKLYPHSQVMLEQRLDTGVPTCWGTSDTVIASPQHVEIIDLKYGQGVPVEAEGNPQLRLYALGALDTYGDILGETEIVRVTVHQPRLDHVLTEEIHPEDLRAWREWVIPIAEEALSDDAHFGPSEEACRWCPASGRCQAQLEEVFKEDFHADLETLTPEDVAATLPRIPIIRDWLNAFEIAALDMAYSEGQEIPGYKVVMSGGRRSIQDHEAVLEALMDGKGGYDFDEVGKRTARGIGELEKLLGQELFDELVAPHVKKGEGKPSLVHEDDKRPAINPEGQAAKDFKEES